MNEERKLYEDWLHQSPEFADTIISAWDVWMGRAALAQPEPAAPTEPAPGWCKHCRQYTIEEPLKAAPTVVEPVAWAIVAENTGKVWHVELDREYVLGHNPAHIVPLYATPPRTALTLDDALIRAMALEHSSASFGRAGDDDSTGGWMFDYDDLIVFARAIEAAHGIGEKK